ncbi:MAG: hypothetical protein KatS3mg104_2917 [Phycisphaerae bacterium]|nr:MAG: hypothetical protein KatS3mg104_2917 [Phycisphaerae bacterium]
MIIGSWTGDPIIYGQMDQRSGGLFAFGLIVLWVGRAHGWLVIKQAFRGEKACEPKGRYLSYSTAFWVLVLCVGVMVGWMVLAGGDWLGSIVPVLLLLAFFMLIARIIAETGLVTRVFECNASKTLANPVLDGVCASDYCRDFLTD